MKVTWNTLTAWVKPTSEDTVEVAMAGFGPEELAILLQKMSDLQEHPLKLVLTHELTDEQLEALAQCISAYQGILPFSQLSLDVDNTMLQRPAYLSLVHSLKRSSLQGLSLNFPEDELKKSRLAIAQCLENTMASQVHYPVFIGEQSTKKPSQDPIFEPFIASVITRVQQYNQALRWQTSSHDVLDSSSEVVQSHATPVSPLDKKIKLKELIKPNESNRGIYDDFITVEVQHIEIEQQQQIQMVEEVTQTNVTVQEVEQGIFEGELIDFKRFKDAPYTRVAAPELYDALPYELFGTMAHAIRFLSHNAAMKIAENSTAFATLNKDNLPQNFILKHISTGQLVLDYDPYAEERATNAYTPKAMRARDAATPIYTITLPAAIQKKKQAFHLPQDSKQLDNVWIKYGEMGIDYLLEAFQGLDQKHRGFFAFILKNYLKDFSHWDRFIDDRRCIDALDRIKQYDENKLNCFKAFLEHHDNSPFELHDLATGFDAFWAEWEALAKTNGIHPASIIGQWSQPKMGNPLVFMERLITILKNARNVPEQIACLSGLGTNKASKLSLRNYEAYHASKEGFHIVAVDMGFHYDPAAQPDVEFNPETPLYRETWSSLIEASQHLSEAQYYQKAYRIIGQQHQSVRVDDFILGLQEYINTPHRKTNKKNTELVMQALFFVAHERYKGNVGVSNVLSSLVEGILGTQDDANAVLARGLAHLFDQGIHLNEREGIALSQSINLLKETYVDSDQYTQKLMQNLQNNSYATLNFLQFLSSEFIFKTEKIVHGRIMSTGVFARPIVYALDTAAYLMQQSELASFYRADLLLFSELMNKDNADIAYHYTMESGGGGGNIKTRLSTSNYYEGLTKEHVGCGLLKLTQEDPSLFKGSIQIRYSTPSKAEQEGTEYAVSTTIFIIFDQNKGSFEIGFYGPGKKIDNDRIYQYVQKPINDKALCERLKFYINTKATQVTKLEDILDISTLLTSLESRNHVLHTKMLDTLLMNHDGFIQYKNTMVYYKYNRSDLVGYRVIHALEANAQKAIRPMMRDLKDNTLHLATDEQLEVIRPLVTRHTNLVEQLDEIKAFLLKGVGKTPNNIDSAYKAIVRSRHYFDATACIAAFKEIDALPNYDYHAVDAILKRHGFILKYDLPEIFARDSQNLKTLMIEIILVLETGKFITPISDPPEAEHLQWAARSTELSGLNNNELRQLLKEAWKKSDNTMLSYVLKIGLQPTLYQLKQALINEAFVSFDQSAFSIFWKTNVVKLPEFEAVKDLEQFDDLFVKATHLAVRLKSIMSRDNFKLQQAYITEALTQFVDCSKYDYDTVVQLVLLLDDMPFRDYGQIVHTFFKYCHQVMNKTQRSELLFIISSLHESDFPSSYIVKCMDYYQKIHNRVKLNLFVQQLQTVFAKDKDDPLLQFIMELKGVNASVCKNISQLTYRIKTQRSEIAQLMSTWGTGKKPILSQMISKLRSYPSKNATKIIEILAACHASPPSAQGTHESINYVAMVTKIHQLNDAELRQLHRFLRKNKVSLTCLASCLDYRNPKIPFKTFLAQFEKAPFGARDFESQFDISHIERVINGLHNLNNKSSNHYKYTYRKQLMEAFLFVNRAGYDLPVYRNKPARELSNNEIRELFAELKSGKFTQFDLFQKRVYALGLMREAMYRTTGQFPYSTQIIALLDCMMHEGDVIQNIDTGQGKSLVDTMKGVLLWFESDHVVISSSSMVDAKRDLEIYSPFLSVLGVPYAKSPISASMPFDQYCTQGINYTTIAQSALFFSRAQGEQVDIGHPDDVVSLVMNESDYTILDDRTIYRYAVTGGTGLMGEQHEWIYDAINQFVEKTDFRMGITSEKQDIAALKHFLLSQAKEQKKSPKIIHQFTDDKLLMYIESAIIVNYRLRENFDYVLTEHPETKMIQGEVRTTRTAKLLMKDGKVSVDTQYGNGMQQLLYAKLNKKWGKGSFVLEPESHTIISSNNKNRIDYYRTRKGRIWGSSGTVGSHEEIDGQYRKYGFEFSKIEPHQRKQVKIHHAHIEADEVKQFMHIASQLASKKWFVSHQPPAVVFFKDIDTAERFKAYMQEHYPKETVQFFMGLGNEEYAIRNAATPGMITITTPALGRNTDIPYDKTIGMTVIQTFIGSAREDMQRSGRTGRQGSEGDIHYILNQQDCKGKTKEDIQSELNERAEKERRFNEELYNILGALLIHVGKADKAFFREQWARFSDHVETQYREAQLYSRYRREQFLQTIIKEFNHQISKEPISMEQLNERVAAQYVDYQPYTKPVTVSECIPPEIIAYQFIHPVSQEQTSFYSKEAVKSKLEQLFSAVHHSNYAVVNNDYIAYLNAGHASMSLIKEAHQEFLSDYLKQQVVRSEHTSWIKRWLGFEGHLNKLTHSPHYLLMFKAIVDVRGTTVDVEAIKAVVVTMLKEYVEYSWFVRAENKQAALHLMEDIKQCTNIPSVIACISKSKLDRMESDIIENRYTFWRKIKPVHFSGHSRFQATLDRTMALIHSVTQTQLDDQIVDQLTEKYKKTVKKPEGISLFSEKKSVDLAKKQMEHVDYEDSSNAKVIEKSIDSALTIKNFGGTKIKP